MRNLARITPLLMVLNLTLVTVSQTVLSADLSKADVDFFENKIRPVLVKHCYECHSSKSDELGGKLLLDSREGILSGGESGPALVAGKPNESLIIQSLRYEDTEMPPEEPLPEVVVNDFINWIKRGAPDPRRGSKDAKVAVAKDSAQLSPAEHWSFFPRHSPQDPKVENGDWAKDSIDRFVLAKIEADDLAPTGDASAETLVRRLYYDLIGLPPAADRVAKFVADFKSDERKATEELVDELLASPQFGERWGRHWLDVARYGESNGDDGLGRNASFPHAWRYRDYVIQAINDDVPYDKFLLEQIAGDLLPAESAVQRNRQIVATGFLAIGAKPAAAMNKNFAMDVVDDQINVVSTGVMGLSVACARCHDHKHDPIPTRDYYAMAGIFNSTETLYGNAANEKLTAPPTPLHKLVSTWKKNQPKQVALKTTPKFPADYGEVIQQSSPVVYARLDAASEALKVEGKVKFTGDDFAVVDNSKLAGQLKESAASYSVSFWFRNDMENNKRPITAYLFSRAKAGPPETGDHLGIGGTHDKSRTGKLFVFNGSKTKKSIAGETVVAPGTWNHVVLVRNGNQIDVYLNGVTEPEVSGELPATFGESKSYSLATRSDKFAPLKGNVAEFAVFDRALKPDEIERLHSASGQPKGVRAPRSQGVAMGVREKAKPADCKVHINGETGKFGPLVKRGFLSAHASAGWQQSVDVPAKDSGRLQLAEWLTRPDHPQTARVMVNRIWLHLFGQAIVATPDDFGVYGARPSHPKLLDHLANRFVEDGWSVKKMIRAIVLTRTYQLDSRISPGLLEADPDNKLFTHHLRRRLDAEAIRDSLLAAAAALDLSPGEGSAVQTTDVLINWPPGESTNLHRESQRRSVYLCMLRHAPPPELAAFDLPDPVKVVGRRNDTTLPSQSLFFLNSPFVLKQAESMASAILALDGVEDADRVGEVYRRALQRSPSADEVDRALSYIRATESTLPEAKRRLQSWASFCQAILASNEFRYID